MQWGVGGVGGWGVRDSYIHGNTQNNHEVGGIYVYIPMYISLHMYMIHTQQPGGRGKHPLLEDGEGRDDEGGPCDVVLRDFLRPHRRDLRVPLLDPLYRSVSVNEIYHTNGLY